MSQKSVIYVQIWLKLKEFCGLVCSLFKYLNEGKLTNSLLTIIMLATQKTFTKSKNLKPLLQKTQNRQIQARTPSKIACYALKNTKTPNKSCQFTPFKDRKLRVKPLCQLIKNRAKLIDWYLEVFSIFQLSWETFWFTVELLDTLIADFNYVTSLNIHLVGIVCCFISAKMIRTGSLSIKSVISAIGHNKFSSSQILMEEAKILHLIFKHSNFQRITIYSFLMQKYATMDKQLLRKAFEMLCLAFMKPEVSYDAMEVTTYRQLVDYIMKNLCSANKKKLLVLERIRREIVQMFGNQNVSLYAWSICL